MSDMLPPPAHATKTIAQDARGTMFSRGVATLVSLFFDQAYPRRRLSRFNVIGKFRAVEDGMDAAVPVDAKNAPTRDLETTKQFPQRPHRSSFLQEEKEQRRTLRVCQSDCLNRGVHPTAMCPKLCPLNRRKQGDFLNISMKANSERPSPGATIESRTSAVFTYTYRLR